MKRVAESILGTFQQVEKERGVSLVKVCKQTGTEDESTSTTLGELITEKAEIQPRLRLQRGITIQERAQRTGREVKGIMGDFRRLQSRRRRVIVIVHISHCRRTYTG